MPTAARHVLIIEDDPLTALVLSEYLSAHGFRTTVARTGSEGVARFLAERPDLALVDVLLPKKNGFEVCLDIKHTPHGRRTPVVLMSAIYRNLGHAEDYARRLSADGFLLKPFDLDELLEQVHRLLCDA